MTFLKSRSQLLTVKLGNKYNNIGNRRLFYPSPGIDFEVSGVLSWMGLGLTPVGVGLEVCVVIITKIEGEYISSCIPLSYCTILRGHLMPYRNTSLCRYTGVHVTTCIPMGFTSSSLLLTGTLVGLTK